MSKRPACHPELSNCYLLPASSYYLLAQNTLRTCQVLLSCGHPLQVIRYLPQIGGSIRQQIALVFTLNRTPEKAGRIVDNNSTLEDLRHNQPLRRTTRKLNFWTVGKP